MAAKQLSFTPLYCIQPSRFRKQDGWTLWDLSLSFRGDVAVTGYNKDTYRTSITVYSSVRNSDCRGKPEIFYSKEFPTYRSEAQPYYFRCVSFFDDEVLVSCLCNRLELFSVSKDEDLQSRKIKGEATCLSVRKKKAFIGFKKSNKITVYDVTNLNEIKSIILQGFQDGYWPYDMTVAAEKIFVAAGDGKEGSVRRTLIFDEKNARIMSELVKPTHTHWYASSVTVCVLLGVVAVVWWFESSQCKEGQRYQIVFYPLSGENISSFLSLDIETGVSRIRISDRGDRMVTENDLTGEVKGYDVMVVSNNLRDHEPFLGMNHTELNPRTSPFQVGHIPRTTNASNNIPSLKALTQGTQISINPTGINSRKRQIDTYQSHPPLSQREMQAPQHKRTLSVEQSVNFIESQHAQQKSPRQHSSKSITSQGSLNEMAVQSLSVQNNQTVTSSELRQAPQDEALVTPPLPMSDCTDQREVNHLPPTITVRNRMRPVGSHVIAVSSPDAENHHQFRKDYEQGASQSDVSGGSVTVGCLKESNRLEKATIMHQSTQCGELNQTRQSVDVSPRDGNYLISDITLHVLSVLAPIIDKNFGDVKHLNPCSLKQACPQQGTLSPHQPVASSGNLKGGTSLEQDQSGISPGLLQPGKSPEHLQSRLSSEHLRPGTSSGNVVQASPHHCEEVLTYWNSLEEQEKLRLQVFRDKTDDTQALVRRLVERIFSGASSPHQPVTSSGNLKGGASLEQDQPGTSLGHLQPGKLSEHLQSRLSSEHLRPGTSSGNVVQASPQHCEEGLTYWNSLEEHEKLRLQVFRDKTDDRGALVRRLVEIIFSEEERKTHNCSGKLGFASMDKQKLMKVRKITFYLCPVRTKEIDSTKVEDKEWKRLCGVIDTANRHLRGSLKKAAKRK